MKLLYAGFDKLEVSFQGALPKATLKTLQIARDEAAERQSKVLVRFGPGKVAMHVAGNGIRGGYAFVADTGPLGETWIFKNNSEVRHWNIAAFVHSSSLVAYGYYQSRDRLWQRLEAMGCTVLRESVRRVDYALDFLAPDFEPGLEQFVAHRRCKVAPYWGTKKLSPNEEHKPSAVFRARKIETVTIGRMPGRQVCVYDKRREAIEQRKLHWFAVWELDHLDPSQRIWRVEVRAGKRELKDTWGISTFKDLEDSIGDVLLHAVSQVRYLDNNQTDSNISRQRLHPIWQLTQQHLSESLMEFRSGLLPGQVKAIEQGLAVETYTSLIAGNAAALAVVLGMSDKEIRRHLPEKVSAELRAKIQRKDGRFEKSLVRARERLYFVVGTSSN